MSKIKFANILIFYFLLGLTSTAPALAIPVGGYISLFTIFLAVCTLHLLFCFGSNKVPKSDARNYRYYMLWLIAGVLSGLFGAVYFQGEPELWSQTSFGSISKVLHYILIAILIGKNNRREEIVKYLLYGLLWGMIMNIGWSVIDAVMFYLTGDSINNTVFAGYAEAVGARYGILSLTYGPTIRSSGFNMDPANVGLFIIIVFAYALRAHKKLLIALCVLGVFATASMTAIVGMMMSAFIYYLRKPQVIVRSLISATVIVAIIIAILPRENIVVESVGILMDSRIEQKKEAGNDKDNQRIVYLKYFVPAIEEMPTSLIIGTGFFTSSYPYLKSNFCKAEEFRPYDPEQTYIAVFFDCGLIGFIFFCFFYKGIFSKFFRKDYDDVEEDEIIQYAGIEGTLSAFLFYHYVLYSVTMLIAIAGIFKISKKYVYKQK